VIAKTWGSVDMRYLAGHITRVVEFLGFSSAFRNDLSFLRDMSKCIFTFKIFQRVGNILAATELKV